MEKKVLGGKDKVKVAVVQTPPVFLDKEKTIAKACEKIIEAGNNGAELISFAETFIPTYPYWGAGWEIDNQDWAIANITLQENSVVIPSDDTEILCEAARKADAYVVMGLNEMDDRLGSRTIFNSLLFISREGKIMGRHRKLMPTYMEKLYWGFGDASDLNVFDTDIGRIGGLICWENHMILIRAAMITKGEEIHCCCWPGSWSFKGPRVLEPIADDSCDLYAAVREHAFEMGGYVLSNSGILTKDDVPDDFPYKDTMNFDWAIGGSCIAGPDSSYLADPVFNEDTILYSELEANVIKAVRVVFDQLGHYSRFDVATLALRDEPWVPYVPIKDLSQRVLARLSFSEMKRISEEVEVDMETMEKILLELEKAARVS
jgi:amidase/nitrilase